MAKQFNLTVSSPILIEGGYTVNSDLLIVATINNVDLNSDPTNDIIYYSCECYVSQAAKDSEEGQIIPKGFYLEVGPQKQKRQYQNTVLSSEITWEVDNVANKQEFTTESQVSFAGKVVEQVSTKLGINAGDITVS